MEINLENWPPVGGRYKNGNKKSPVAVCTNATVEGIELDMEKIAICGKCVTENIGIEKIIQNIISNPNIRFLILCGKVSKGHFVDQAIISLKKNGIDKEKRIIGAKGNTPFLKGIDEGQIERFRQQIEIIDLSGEENPKKIMRVVENCLRKNPGIFTGKAMKIEEIEEIEAKTFPKWIPDPKGFFVISINPHRNKIIVEYFQNNKLTKKIIGNSAEEISKTIAKLNLIGDFEQTLEHSMYLARELQKAEFALKNRLDYEQDSELNLKKDEKKESIDENDWFD
ncbi:tetrahydromethanopterin S-methyltransferase subunit A [Patescibacteria group bacterium]|nr:tetrahydromethanopterin S-methyltransferase subunit A [Patescibacteria group bacterium]